MTTPHLPGRLGNPDLTLADDPRADPRMVAAMLPVGLAARTPEQPVTLDTPLESLHEFNTMAEAGFDAVFTMFTAALPPVPGVQRSIEVIKGIDGNDITLYIHRPEGVEGPLPGVLHLHGGGMTILEASGASYQRWRDHLAASGLVVVRRRVPQRQRQARAVPVPCWAQRLQLGPRLVRRPAHAPGGHQDRRVRRVRRRQPHPGHHAEGQARRQPRRDRRGVRAVPVHLQRLRGTGAGADIVVRERRLLPEL